MIRTSYFLIILMSACFVQACKRTPEAIIRDTFCLDISKEQYEVIDFSEHWCLNGDGETSIILDFKTGLSEKAINLIIERGGKSLPIPQDLPLFLSSDVLDASNGLYVLWNLSVGNYLYWDYCLLVYDYDKKQMYFRLLFK